MQNLIVVYSLHYGEMEKNIVSKGNLLLRCQAPFRKAMRGYSEKGPC